MKRKYFAVLPFAAVIALAGCSADPPTAPTVTATPPTVTQTVTEPPPPPVTQAVTPTPAPEKSKPAPRPTETAKHKKVDCVDKGVTTTGWNTLMDVPSEDELQLTQNNRGHHWQPTIDAPLVDSVNAWTGPCYDSVEFIVDTSMVDPALRDNPDYSTRPWFNVSYVDTVTTSGEGAEVPLLGSANLQVVMYVKGRSFEHWSGHTPPNLLDVMAVHRHTGDNFGALREIAGAGDYENVVTFGLGVDQKRPFSAHFHDYGNGRLAVVVRIAH